MADNGLWTVPADRLRKSRWHWFNRYLMVAFIGIVLLTVALPTATARVVVVTPVALGVLIFLGRHAARIDVGADDDGIVVQNMWRRYELLTMDVVAVGTVVYALGQSSGLRSMAIDLRDGRSIGVHAATEHSVSGDLPGQLRLTVDFFARRFGLPVEIHRRPVVPRRSRP